MGIFRIMGIVKIVMQRDESKGIDKTAPRFADGPWGYY